LRFRVAITEYSFGRVRICCRKASAIDVLDDDAVAVLLEHHPRAAVELGGAVGVLGDRVAPVTEGALRELHDVALVDQGEARELVGDRVVERGADEALGALLRDRLDAEACGVREAHLGEGLGEVVAQEVAELVAVGGAGGELDAGVDVLGVLAEDHHVGVLRALDRRGHALEPADRAQADVEVELLAQGDVEAADAAADRGGEGALDADQLLAEDGEGLLGQPAAGLLEGLLAGEHLAPLDLALAAVGLRDRGVEHADRGRPDVGADPVALDEGDDGIVGDRESLRSHLDRIGHRRPIPQGPRGLPTGFAGPWRWPGEGM
jgi:hypothetical protein